MRTRESSLKYEEEMARLLIAANELNSDLLELGIQIINPLFANNQLFITEQIRGGNISENKRNKFIFSLSTIMEQFLKGKKGDPLWKDIMCDYHKLDNYIKSGGIVYWIDPFFNYTEI